MGADWSDRSRRMPRSCQSFPIKSIGKARLLRAVGDGEHPAEREDGTERTGRIRRADSRAVVGQEVRGLVGVEHGQDGTQSGALVPLAYRVDDPQDVPVGW